MTVYGMNIFQTLSGPTTLGRLGRGGACVSVNWIWCSNLKNNAQKWGKIPKRKQRKHSSTVSAWSWLSFSNETIWKEKTQLKNASWFKNLSWLHYSKEKDSVFCIFCIRHKGKLTAEHNMEEAYITKGFNNWKKALEAFVDHQQSKAHRAAITYESVLL